MAYTKHTWLERLGTKLNRFKDMITSTYFELVNEPTSVSQAGTPIRVDWLNEMEQGIFDAHVTADAALPATAQAADSAKLEGRVTSYTPVLGGIPRWSASGTIALQAEAFYENGTRLSDLYLRINAKAANSALLNGYAESYDNTSGTIVRRSTIDGNISVGPIKEAGTMLSAKYLGITAQAADSALLNGYVDDYAHTGRTIARRGLAGDLNATTFREGGTTLANKYAPKTLYGTTVPSSLLPGQIFVQI